MTAVAEPWTLQHGASWLTEDGSIHVVPGFHEEWIQAHPELVGGCANVCEVVLRKSWISVAVFNEGYVELLVPRRGDEGVVARIERLLASNAGQWRHVLLMFMDVEGYETLSPEDIRPDGTFRPELRARL
jgi:hypothetical protein